MSTRFFKKIQKYTHTWEQEKLGEICSINCGSLDANAMEHNGKYDFFTSGVEIYKINKYAFEGPGISIAGNGANMGYLHLTDGKYTAYQRTYILQNIEVNRMFLYCTLLNNFLPKCEKLTKFGGVPYLVLEQIYNHMIFRPTYNEQTKISSLFSNLDSLITIHQWECNFWKFRNFVFDFLKFQLDFLKKYKNTLTLENSEK
ncbi:restriction endonuclease subunit S [Mycoplasma capricolum subsp. capripneumoniae]|nr:restriction endonuclease subunit S [Mycoplasma capricolum subsp. capripneumoniae]QDL20619.1 restriction endonuclease subunit S [Mycoplasma capricolum subsp. capripneumoniae]QDL21305.1 restriction endonuclease subunit S [Mycoplasma capricolum subsp. capripneumoniae]QIF40572.1 restriction endonuclease subunit S [Mycoplasma capricolum subsp. capripneumoniae]QIN44092.1 restriction endonuclease subunit S [Mycoplasma capricolum subsp. capripneumoniae]